MVTRGLPILWLGAVSVGFLLAGCNGDGDEAAPPVGPSVGGSWAGYYERPGYREDITASISQDGDAVAIKTSMEGEGHLFTGTIAEDGYLFLTDAATGEAWTSYGDVTSTHMRFRDYFYDPDLGKDSPEQDIWLWR